MGLCFVSSVDAWRGPSETQGGSFRDRIERLEHKCEIPVAPGTGLSSRMAEIENVVALRAQTKWSTTGQAEAEGGATPTGGGGWRLGTVI